MDLAPYGVHVSLAFWISTRILAGSVFAGAGRWALMTANLLHLGLLIWAHGLVGALLWGSLGPCACGVVSGRFGEFGPL